MAVLQPFLKYFCMSIKIIFDFLNYLLFAPHSNSKKFQEAKWGEFGCYEWLDVSHSGESMNFLIKVVLHLRQIPQ